MNSHSRRDTRITTSSREAELTGAGRVRAQGSWLARLTWQPLLQETTVVGETNWQRLRALLFDQLLTAVAVGKDCEAFNERVWREVCAC